MEVLKREDIAPGAAKVALTGQRCTEWPPLQVDPVSGVPTMEDRGTLGARIDQQGAFYNYFITWPGNRLPMDDLREVSDVCKGEGGGRECGGRGEESGRGRDEGKTVSTR